MTSTLNTLKSNSGSRKKKLRKGRGIAAGQGASCGFGMRGQKSRSGRPTRPGFEGGQMPLYRRVPKLKHFEIINQKNFSIINLDKLNSLSDLYLRPLINKNIEELILGCSHYPLIYDLLRKKLDSNIKIIDPSVALIKKFNESFAILETDRYESISFEDVKFFVTSGRDEFSNKVKFWLGINKEIRLVNLRSNV